MGPRIQVWILVFFTQVLVIAAETDGSDLSALNSLKTSWRNWPPNWKGLDPCGNSWEGIKCNNSRVINITLAGIGIIGNLSEDITLFSALQFLDLSNNIGLEGSLPPSIGNLKNLSVLILINCSLVGPIPDSIGSLGQLTFLALNSNSFNGSIPPSIGNLSKLSWLDLTDNMLTGSIPVSPGLDKLVTAKHFHLANNQLSDAIPPQLFSSNMTLMHVVLDNNRLTGNIPSTLGYVKTLTAIRLDWNSLSGSVPLNLNNLTNVEELYLSNNKLTGLVPNLTGMGNLSYVDMSNNSFTASEVPPWFSNLKSLKTLLMERTQLRGEIPVNLFSNPDLQNIVLSNNQLNGTLDIGTNYSTQLLLDLQNNSITVFLQRARHDGELLLAGNPICEGTEATTERYCGVPQKSNPISSKCYPSDVDCSSDKNSRAYYTGTLRFVFVGFLNLENSSYLNSLMESLIGAIQLNRLPVGAISYIDPIIDRNTFQLKLQVFPPSGQYIFNRTEISQLGTLLNYQRFELPDSFGPLSFRDEPYCCFEGRNKSPNTGIIIGAAVSCSVLVVLLLSAGFYAFHENRRAKRAIARNNPFAFWELDESNGSIPQLKEARWFSFEELKKCTNNFSEANGIGSGGYGKVYKGTLADAQLIAIKRAQRGSLQGALEFKTEMELLSRIHHKNVINLVGFCYEQGEQMIVYEYIPNGTLKDSLSGKSGIRLDWMRRLKVALDSARGLAYLHELANPPIIHRDIKSNNILLDGDLNAKVADFGISKPMGDVAKGCFTDQVKGTLGYLDPEYYMTQQLTEKSDVYSFGIVLLELITAKGPIERGKHIVRVVELALDKSKGPYNLRDVLDPMIDSGTTLGGLEKFVDLAMSCVKESGSDRPTMGEVVREIENILKLASLNLNTESAAFTSSSFEGATKGDLYHTLGSDQTTFAFSGSFLPFDVERTTDHI